jgi:hypothetical protein
MAYKTERVKKTVKRTQSIKTESSTTASLPESDRQFIRKIKIAQFIQNAAAQSGLKLQLLRHK